VRAVRSNRTGGAIGVSFKGKTGDCYSPYDGSTPSVPAIDQSP
jgi:hypothetical protein